MLEGRRYPYEGSYRVIGRTTTDADGKFSFKPELDRNHRPARHRARPGASNPTSLKAYVLPAFELSFRALRPGVVRLYQRYTVPKTVRADRTDALLPGQARRQARLACARRGELKRTSARPLHVPGHRDAPGSWHGAFRYASCFRPSAGSGMGDPRATCPKLEARF